MLSLKLAVRQQTMLFDPVIICPCMHSSLLQAAISQHCNRPRYCRVYVGVYVLGGLIYMSGASHKDIGVGIYGQHVDIVHWE